MNVGLVLFFYFKQKTAYDMRISDWSSDVCSSDLGSPAAFGEVRGKSAERPVDPAVYLEDGDLQHNAEHHGGGDLRVLVRDLAARDGRLDDALQHGDRTSTRLNSSH